MNIDPKQLTALDTIIPDPGPFVRIESLFPLWSDVRQVVETSVLQPPRIEMGILRDDLSLVLLDSRTLVRHPHYTSHFNRLLQGAGYLVKEYLGQILDEFVGRRHSSEATLAEMNERLRQLDQLHRCNGLPTSFDYVFHTMGLRKILMPKRVMKVEKVVELTRWEIGMDI